jgi:CRP/FNR family transcriptional regulator
MDIRSIQKVPIFSKLNEVDSEQLNGIIKVKTFNKDDIIFFDTEPYRGFYFVVTGLVKIYKISKEGREHILHLIEPHNTFAEVPLFENIDDVFTDDFRYPANAMALEDHTTLGLVPAREFTELLKNNSSISLKMLSGFAKRLRHLSRHIEEISLKDVTKRVAGFILTEYKNQSNGNLNKTPEIKLNISKNDLASYLGTIIETLSRTLKKLQNEEVITVEGRTIIIKDPERLKELSG